MVSTDSGSGSIMVGMTRIVREAVDRYARRMGITERATEAQDPIYHFQWEHLRRVLETADMAMEDEGIPEESRSRVIRTILYGAPDEADAERRIHDREQMVKLLAETRTPLLYRQGGL